MSKSYVEPPMVYQTVYVEPSCPSYRSSVPDQVARLRSTLISVDDLVIRLENALGLVVAPAPPENEKSIGRPTEAIPLAEEIAKINDFAGTTYFRLESLYNRLGVVCSLPGVDPV